MSEKHIPWLNPNDLIFPNVESAWEEPNGLLAAGGDLTSKRLITAYTQAIFPWYNKDEPILWWSPNPRCVLIPTELKISKSLKKTINKNKFLVTFNTCFKDVMKACALPREELKAGESGTWISDEMIHAYSNLHNEGFAHSVECWKGDNLVGGLYGLAIGKVFFGESMFSTETDASKVAFATLCSKLVENNFKLIDGQVYSPHLESLGFNLIPRSEFVSLLNTYTNPEESLTFTPTRSESHTNT